MFKNLKKRLQFNYISVSMHLLGGNSAVNIHVQWSPRESDLEEKRERVKRGKMWQKTHRKIRWDSQGKGKFDVQR